MTSERRSVDDWLADILHWGARLESHLNGVDWKRFLADTTLQDAVSKCLESIGEAAGRLDQRDPELSHRYFGEQLKQARRSRDRLSHGYYHIDLAILWHTATESIPPLVAAAGIARNALQSKK